MLAEAYWFAGEKFLAMPSRNISPGAAPQLSSFWAKLQQHLTNLKSRAAAWQSQHAAGEPWQPDSPEITHDHA